jgi:hypothetical protein
MGRRLILGLPVDYGLGELHVIIISILNTIINLIKNYFPLSLFSPPLKMGDIKIWAALRSCVCGLPVKPFCQFFIVIAHSLDLLPKYHKNK